MPGRGDEKKHDAARDEAHPEKVAQITYQKQKNEDNRVGEYETDEALGQDVQSDGCRKSPARESCGASLLPAQEKEVHPQAEPEPDHQIRNQDARKKVRSERGRAGEGRPKSCFWRHEFAAEQENDQEQRKNSERLRQPRGPLAYAEEPETRRHCPVGKRRFFEITNTVLVKRDPVMSQDHFAGCFGVRGIGIVKK